MYIKVFFSWYKVGFYTIFWGSIINTSFVHIYITILYLCYLVVWINLSMRFQVCFYYLNSFKLKKNGSSVEQFGCSFRCRSQPTCFMFLEVLREEEHSVCLPVAYWPYFIMFHMCPNLQRRYYAMPCSVYFFLRIALIFFI